MSSMMARACVPKLLSIAVAAGDAIMEDYQSENLQALQKEDDTPVTDTDLIANDIIVSALLELTPTIPVISEELDPELNEEIAKEPCYWLVDPLDGTRAFLAGVPEFTVNIAFVEHGIPTVGVIYVPPTQTLYYTGPEGGGFRKKRGGKAMALAPQQSILEIEMLVSPTQALTGHRELERMAVLPHRAVHSALKFCLLAAGQARYYPRTRPAKIWDIAAGHALLSAVGGKITGLEDGLPLRYDLAGLWVAPFLATSFTK
jgi:3'(2'), 5'-bisphosphate nucleotidase